MIERPAIVHGVIGYAPLLLLGLQVVQHESWSSETELQDPAAQSASVQEIFGLKPPYSIERLAMYSDGGSYGGLIRDVEGKELLFAWDGRMRGGPQALPEDALHLCYIGSDYPGGAGSSPLGIGTPEERALVFVLRSFANAQLTRARQDSLYAIRFDYTRSWESRRPLLGSLTAKQMMALDGLWIARYLERQALPGGLKGWPWPKPP